jgi:hypothetical protein
MAVIQYSKAGFSNHGTPHNRGVTQSPEFAMARLMAA